MSIKTLIIYNKTTRFLLFVLFLLFCWFLGATYNFKVDIFKNYLSQFPIVASGIIFIFLYVVLTFFIWFGPKDILRITSALLFGTYISTILIWISESINAFILFSVSRKMGREFVENKFHLKHYYVSQVEDDTSFIGILAIRINPLIPFRVMDLGAGLSRISLKKYIIAVIIASSPRILWLQWILSDVGMNLFKSPKIMLDYFLQKPEVLIYSVAYFLIVFILSILSILLKMLRKNNERK